MVDHVEFSSPHNAYKLDTIPTTLLRFLNVFGPCLDYLAQLCQMARRHSSHTIVLLFVWNTLCFWTLPCLCLFPSFFIYTRVKKRLFEQEQLKLEDTMHALAVLLETAEYFKQQPLFNYAEDMSALTYAWPVWVLLCCAVGTHGMFALLGSIWILSASPQVVLVWWILRKNRVVAYLLSSLWAYGMAAAQTTTKFTPFSIKSAWWHFRNSAKTEKAKANKILLKATVEPTRQEKIAETYEFTFQFDIYENQRWWLGANWTTDMMENERRPWTDSQLKPLLSKKDFKLPETSLKYEDGQKVKKCWEWIDKEWTDDIWEYGDNSWQNFSSTPSLQTFTRRRRWHRRAMLIESIEKE